MNTKRSLGLVGRAIVIVVSLLLGVIVGIAWALPPTVQCGLEVGSPGTCPGTVNCPTTGDCGQASPPNCENIPGCITIPATPEYCQCWSFAYDNGPYNCTHCTLFPQACKPGYPCTCEKYTWIRKHYHRLDCRNSNVVDHFDCYPDWTDTQTSTGCCSHSVQNC
jgi:hypothetical protein